MVALGLVDDPGQQAQVPYLWDLEAGPLAVTGPLRSGRTTALLTVAVQLALVPADVHVYAVHTGGLAVLDEEPWPELQQGGTLQERETRGQPLLHVGAAVDLTDLSRLERLVTLLGQPPQRRAALRVLLVDDWEAVASALLDARQLGLLDALAALVRQGHRHGVRAVVTGSRAAVSGPLAGAFAQRLLLQPVDPVDLALAGVPVRAAGTAALPGRGIDVASRRQVQLAVPGEDGSPAARTAYLGQVAARCRDGVEPVLPPRVRRLPSEVSWEQLAPPDDVAPTDGLVPVGRAPDGPAGFRLDRGQRRVAILGGRGSGRTTALATLGLGLVRLGHPVAALSATGEFSVPDAVPVAVDDVDLLVALRQRHPGLAVLVDDADQLAGASVEPVVAEVARLVDQDRGFVAAATSFREALDRPRGVAGSLAAAGSGMLLGPPKAGDELALGLRGLVPHAGCPGRAYLVQDGVVEVVQLAR